MKKNYLLFFILFGLLSEVFGCFRQEPSFNGPSSGSADRGSTSNFEMDLGNVLCLKPNESGVEEYTFTVEIYTLSSSNILEIISNGPQLTYVESSTSNSFDYTWPTSSIYFFAVVTVDFYAFEKSPTATCSAQSAYSGYEHSFVDYITLTNSTSSSINEEITEEAIANSRNSGNIDLIIYPTIADDVLTFSKNLKSLNETYTHIKILSLKDGESFTYKVNELDSNKISVCDFRKGQYAVYFYGESGELWSSKFVKK